MELLDAQIIYHTHEVLPELENPRSIAVESARASLDAVGVDAAFWYGEKELAELAVTRYPDRFAGVVAYTYADPVPDGEEAATHVRDHPGLVGIRLIPGWPHSGENMIRLREGQYDPVFAAAEKHGIPIGIFMSGYLPETHDIAKRYPDLRLIIDHLGVLPAPNIPLVPERFDNIPQLLELAQYPNVAVKMTGTASMTLEPYPFNDLWPVLHQVLDTFGIERVMWGSDFKRSSAINTYADAVHFITKTTELSDAEKEQLTSKSVRTWFNWTGPSRATAR
jgi:L-fuconolactonase